MKNLFRAAVLTAVAFAPVACNTSSQGGNAGTKDSFTVSGPTMATTIKQGDRETVKISLSRGSDFKKDVKLDATAPSGLKVDLGKKTVAASDPAEVTMTIEVDKGATLGDHVIKVTATPDSGAATHVDVKVKVEGKQ